MTYLIQIATAVDVDWILPSQLQRDRRQFFGGRLHHRLSGLSLSREEDEVEGEVDEQFGPEVRIPVDDGEGGGVEVLWEEARHQLGRRRAFRGRFDDGHVSGGDGADQGGQSVL